MICKCSDLPSSLNWQAVDSCTPSLGCESTAAACVTWNIAIKTTVASPLGDEEQVSGWHLNLVHNVDRNAAKKRKAREHYQDDAISSQASAWGVPTVDASTERGMCDALRLHCHQVGKGQQRDAGGGDGGGNGRSPTCLQRMSFDVAVIKRKRSGVHLIFNPGQGLGAPSDVSPWLHRFVNSPSARTYPSPQTPHHPTCKLKLACPCFVHVIKHTAEAFVHCECN
jgi:hypothetical protein